RICKVIIGCAVLHNFYILVKHTVVVGNTDPLIRENRMRTNEDFEDTEQPLFNLQGLSKGNDLADILFDNM
ncbi:hypothetical protein PHMEG_00015789, partial [Phytophthora megakarya]